MSAVSILLILTLTAIIVFAVWRLKLKKQEPKDVEASGGHICNAGKQRIPKKSINLAPNHAYASMNVPRCAKIRVYPNEVYAICSNKKKPRCLEVNTAPNKAYAVSNVPRCAKIRVYPNEVYAICSNKKKPRCLEVNTAPNKAYVVSNVPRCAKIRVYPNEVYARQL